jgi:peroxiredoxin
MSNKLPAGSAMPEITMPAVGGGDVRLGGARDGWQAVFVYRGLHCPLCKGYLGRVQEKLDAFQELGVEVVAVSGDPKEKAEAFRDEVGLTMPMGYDMSVEQMKQLGLYVSSPRSDAETDRPFPEPGLFVTTDDGSLQIVEVANAPFIRPEIDLVLRGLNAGKNNGYPARGTMA